MVRNTLSAIALGSILFASPCFAEEECQPIKPMHEWAMNEGAKWVVLNRDQFEFIRGYWAASPPPSGLPKGDSAVLVQFLEDGIIIFIDGKNGCSQLPATKKLIKMLDDVLNGDTL